MARTGREELQIKEHETVSSTTITKITTTDPQATTSDTQSRITRPVGEGILDK